MYSPRAATSTSLPTATGLPNCLPSISVIGISLTPRFGASTTTPFLRSICPAAPMPTATIFASFGNFADSSAAVDRFMMCCDTYSCPFSACVRLRSELITSPVLTSTTAARVFVPPRSIPRAYTFCFAIRYPHFFENGRLNPGSTSRSSPCCSPFSR